MPLFDYGCGNCGWTDELLKPRTVVTVDCPKCGKSAARSQINHIGFSGFAETPREHRTYRREFADFKEASAEVDYNYSKLEDGGPEIKRPNYFQEGMKRAKKGIPV